MLKKRLLSILSILMFIGSILTSTATAEGEGKKSLIALGDSIPYGYNLEDSDNEEPSREAYPYIIGKEADVRVRNLGQPGWTTDDILLALSTDQKFIQAIQDTDYVTLSIGSNDLLREFKTEEFQTVIYKYLKTMNKKNLNDVHEVLNIEELTNNLENIISEISTLTDARIIVYNIYNPFEPYADPQNYQIGELLLRDMKEPGINSIIQNALSSFKEVIVVDAYSAMLQGLDPVTFNNEYIIDEDIHPTAEGHKALAQIGLEAIESIVGSGSYQNYQLYQHHN